MRHSMIKIGFAALLFIVVADLHAQAATTSVTQSTAPTIPLVAGSMPTNENQEIVLLRAQLAAAKEFHESILATVYWALGGVFVLVGLLLGFGWLANFKVYERDKSSMKAELEAEIATRIGEIESKFFARMNEIPELITAQTKESVAQAEKTIKSSLATLSGSVFDLELRYLREKMESNPSNNMALTDALNLFRLCQKRSPHELPDIMNFMLKTIDKGGKLTAGEITNLNELLDSLPTHYSTLTEKLRAKVVASDIF